jgi:hypothetical protein
MRNQFILISILTATAFPAGATLGGSVESVGAGQSRLHAKRAVVDRQNYTVHEISSNDGTVIREYVTPGGKVFGVSWSGPTIPDLAQLLGGYNAEFQNSLRSKRVGRKTAIVRNPDLVVESTGHTRAFQGRAYLNSIIPNGVTEDVVK